MEEIDFEGLDAFLAQNQGTQSNADDSIDFESLDQFMQSMPQEERGVGDELLRQGGLTLRAGAEGLAGAASILTDPMAEVINQVVPDEYKIGKLKDSVSQILTDMGVPEPENVTERIVQQASQALVGAGGMIKTGAALGSNAITETGKALTQSFTEKAAEQAAGAIGGAVGQKGAEEAGLGTGGQIAGALIGGAAGYGGVAALKGKITSKEQLKSLMEAEPDNADVAKLKVVGNKVMPDKVAEETIKQGFEPRVISAVKSGSNKDRFNMKKMVAIHKKAQKDAVYSANNRPTDVVGDSLNERVGFLFKSNRKAGTAIDKAANKLRGTKIDSTEINNNFLGKLDEIGVKVGAGEDGKLGFSLKGSDIEGDTASKALLNRIFDRAVNTNTNDAYDLHRLKRFIDTQVSYGKTKANPLSKTTERIVKDLRRDINTKLGEASKGYKVANEKYHDTINALDDIQKAAGTSINMESPNASKSFGTTLRGLLSNNKSRIALRDSLVNAEGVAKKYGMKIDDNIDRQLIFANELDRMFGTSAKTSFQGGIEQGTEVALKAARGNFVDATVDLGKKGVQKMRRINDDNAIKAIEQLLKETK